MLTRHAANQISRIPPPAAVIIHVSLLTGFMSVCQKQAPQDYNVIGEAMKRVCHRIGVLSLRQPPNVQVFFRVIFLCVPSCPLWFKLLIHDPPTLDRR